MKGKDLIKWIQDNHAEDLEMLVCTDGDDSYQSVEPKLKADGYSTLSKCHYDMYKDNENPGDFLQMYDDEYEYEVKLEGNAEILTPLHKWVELLSRDECKGDY